MMQIRCASCGSLAAPNDTACSRCGAALSSAATVPSGELPPSHAFIPTDAEVTALIEELREVLAPRIVLLDQLGMGGMGRVFLAREPALRRLVAVKVLNPALVGDAVAKTRFAREAETAAAVGHPGVVGIYQVGELPKSRSAFFVMQFIDGPSLELEIKPGQGLPAGKVQRIVGEIASALAAAHARGLVHRDIKPANIMLDAESGRVVVLDFGISAVLHQGSRGVGNGLTAEGTAIGTPMYMSPEQGLAQPATSASDVYSLGVVAFELATGRAPFLGTSWGELIAAHIKDPPPPIATLRPDLEGPVGELIDLCLAKEPARRPSAADLERGLLPSTHTLIEWPPPGLAPLRGLLHKLYLAFGAMAGLGLLFQVILLRQPPMTVVPGQLRLKDSFDIVPIWLFALATCVVLTFLLLAVAGVRGNRLLKQWRWGQKEGYPARILLDVAWDYQNDLGQLLNGTGAYLLLDQPTREQLCRRRRLEAAIGASTLGLLMLVPVLWVTGLLGGWVPNSEAMLPGREWAILIVPLVTGAIAFVWAGSKERLLTRATKGTTRWFSRRDRRTLQPGLVASWLGSAGGVPAPRGRRVPLILVEAFAVLLALTFTGASALALFAGISAERWNDTFGPAGEAFVQASRTDSLRWTPWQTQDSLIRSSAVPVDPSAPPDLVAARTLLASDIRVSRNSAPVWNLEGAIPLPTPEKFDPRQAWPVVLALLERLPALPSRSVVDALAQDTLTPALAMFRRMARSNRLPMAWQYRVGYPGVRIAGEIPFPDYAGVKALGTLNLISGSLALADGNPRTALLRARENISFGLQFMNGQFRYGRGVGRVIAAQAVPLMHQIARVTRDPVLRADADRLDATLAQVRQSSSVTWLAWRGVMADPQAAIGLQLLADTTLPPAVRLDALYAIPVGFCFSARELLFGSSPQRLAVLAKAEVALRDIDRSGELVALHRRWLEGVMVGSVLRNDISLWYGLDERWLLRLLVRSDVVSRIAFCQMVML